MKNFKQITFLVVIIISMTNFAKAEQENKNHRHRHGPSIQFGFGGAPFMFFNSGPNPYYYNQNIYPYPFFPRNSYGIRGSRLGLNAWWGPPGIIQRRAIRQKRRAIRRGRGTRQQK